MGYHKKYIEKGVLGTPSKILEETMEFIDATEQKCSIMALLELSDLYGAISLYLQKNHPSVSMGDLERMSYITARAFKSGER